MGGVAQTATVVAACAERLEAELDAVVDRLNDEFVTAMPDFARDEALAEETAASVRGNVETILAVYRGEHAASAVRIRPEVISLARSFVRRRFSLESLVQAYRVGQTMFTRRWMDVLVAEIEDRDVLVDAIRSSTDDVAIYIDRVVVEIVGEYDRENSAWLRRAVARRSEVVDRILRGEPTDVDEAGVVLGYDLRGHHAALLLRATADGDPDAVGIALERHLQRLADRLSVTRVLGVPTGVRSLSAWLGTPQPLADADLVAAAEDVHEPGLSVAAGTSLPDVAGFRRSHEQALRALRVATHRPGDPAVTSYAAFDVPALLSHDDVETREFVARALGALGERNASAERLRDTVRVWLEEGGNARLASERLFTHKNTVIYRVQRAEQLLGEPVRDRALRLQLALLLVEVFGEQLLPDDT